MEHSTSAGRHTRSTVTSQLHTHLGGVLLVVDLDAGQARLEAIQRRRRVSGHGGGMCRTAETGSSCRTQLHSACEHKLQASFACGSKRGRSRDFNFATLLYTRCHFSLLPSFGRIHSHGHQQNITSNTNWAADHTHQAKLVKSRLPCWAVSGLQDSLDRLVTIQSRQRATIVTHLSQTVH